VPSLELGSGAEAHAPLAPGNPVTIVHGPQGGWHVDVSGWVRGTGQLLSVDPRIVRVADGLQVSGIQAPEALAGTPADPCGYEFWAVRALVDIPAGEPDPQAFVCTLDGAELELAAGVVDLTTLEVVAATIPVVGVADPGDACP
jgi:hypothetical protein